MRGVICRAVVTLLSAVVIVVFAAGAAKAADPLVEQMQVKATIDDSGALTLVQEMTFAAAPETLVQRLPQQREALDNSYYTFTYSAISAKIEDQPAEAMVQEVDGFTEVRVPASGAANKKLTLSYTVTGAILRDAQGSPYLSWRMLQGLSVDVRQVKGTVEIPAVLTSMDCTSGPPNSVTKCSLYAGGTHEYPHPFFSDGPRGAGEVVNLEVSYPEGAVPINEQLTQRWSLDRAFSLNLGTLLGLLSVLVVGGFGLLALHRRLGYDLAPGKPTLIAHFVPVGDGCSVFEVMDDVRPGHIGTVADERVDPVDVTATILDLAVRGHLRIHEIAGSAHQPLDWVFERLDGPTDVLRPYERKLLDAVGPADGSPVAVSTLRQAIGPVIGDVQSDLYNEVVARGWFDRRPDDARNSWGRVARIAVVAAVAVTIVLAVFSTWALIGIGLIAVALGMVWVANRMPRRTGAGAELLAGLSVLSGVLQTQPTDQMPAGAEYAELSKILPYAVVLGGKERWIEAIVAADDDPGIADPTDLNWYHAPGDWHLADLPAAMKSFITTVQGELFSR